MFEQLLVTSCGVGAMLTAVTVVGSNLYDIQQVRAQRQLQAHPHARRNRLRPLISVLVYAHNDAATIEQCLQALARCSYRKLEIIVVDACSQDSTRQIVRQFMTNHPRKTVKLSALRKELPNVAAVSSAYKKRATGQLIMCISATDLVDPQALSRAVTQLNIRGEVGIISFSRQLSSVWSLGGLFQTFELAVRDRSARVDSALNTDYAILGWGTLCRRDVFTRLVAHKRRGRSRLSPLETGRNAAKAYYCHEAIIYSAEPASLRHLIASRYHLQSHRTRMLISCYRLGFRRSRDYTWFQKWLRLPLSYAVGVTGLLLPLLLTYFIYLALKLHQPTLYLLSWLIISLCLALAIVGSSHYNLARKLIYSLLSPISYAVVYVLSFVQLFVLLGFVLRRPRRRQLVV